MDLLEFFAIMVPVLMVGFLVTRWISMQDAANRYKAQKDAKISAQNRIAAQQRGKGKNDRNPVQDAVVLGAWVDQLADTFGFDPAVLFEDEMPDEVSRLLPLAKGFMDSGGLQKLLGSAGAQQQLPDAPQEPVMKGGPGW